MKRNFFDLQHYMCCLTFAASAFVMPCSLLAQDGPKGPDRPEFIQPTYIERPSWMRYEDASKDEPIEAVRSRVARYSGQDFAIDTLRWNGPAAIDIVVMGDGYTLEEQGKFSNDVRLCIDHLFKTSPFDRYTEFFNIYALHVVSEESGISHPGQWKETDGVGAMVCPEGQKMPIERKNTFFGTHLDGWGVHRYVGAWNERAAYDLTRAFFPRCKITCVLSNTEEYGGAGGEILKCTCNTASADIFVHELAHTFAELADEYFGGDVYMMEKPNLSSIRDSSKVRWHRWIGEPEVGVFPHKGGRLGSRYVKPTSATSTSRYCKMERLEKEFCPVCRERIIEAIHERTNMIAASSPADSILSPLSKKESITFRLDQVLRPQGDTLKIRWYVDNKLVSEGVSSIAVTGRDLSADEVHEIRLEVFDESPFVRNPTCSKYHTSKRTWLIARKR